MNSWLAFIRPQRRSFIGVASALVVTLALGGCPIPDEVEPPDTARTPITFDVPRGRFADFLQTPFPSDLLRRDLDGESVLDLRAFPNPGASAALDDYLNLIQRTPGWSTTGAMYFHVGDGVDVRTLPQTPAASMAPDASMFLVEVDRPSVRIPIEWEYVEEATSFLPAGTLTVMPVLGTRLFRRAALVVTTDVEALNGVRLGPSEDLEALMGCAPLRDEDAVTVDADCTPYQTLAEELDRDAIEPALLQIFTPQRPAEGLVRAAKHLVDGPLPEVSNLRLVDGDAYSEYDLYEGDVVIQQFQRGDPPFDSFDGTTGSIAFDDDGAAIVQREETVPFVLTIPKRTPLSPEGWPIVVYGHGTGGDNRSAVGEGTRNEAHQLARAGWAMVAIAEPLHEGRRGHVDGSEDLYTFNLLNPAAGRDNWRQSALEKVQMVSMAQALQVSADVSATGDAIPLDGSRIGYMGHSQGAITGAVFLGIDHRIEAAFLSGIGGGFAPSLVDKTEPVNILDVFRTVLQLPSDEPVGYFHPVLTLLQTFIDPADPLNYGAAYRGDYDRDGVDDAERTAHLVATSGLTDQFTPRVNHDGFAAAFGLPQVAPVSDPIGVLDLLNIEAVSAASSGHDVGVDGEPLTTGLLQYADQGHFAIYYDVGAQEAYRRFFQTLREDGVPVAQVQ